MKRKIKLFWMAILFSSAPLFMSWFLSIIYNDNNDIKTILTIYYIVNTIMIFGILNEEYN